MNLLTKGILNHPGRVLAAFGILLGIAVLLTGALRFEQDIFKILPQHNRPFRILLHGLKSSTTQNQLYLVVRGPRESNALVREGQALISGLEALRINGRPAFKKASSLKAEAVGAEAFSSLLVRYLSRPEDFLTQTDLPRLQSFLNSPDALEAELRRSLAVLATPGASRFSRLVAMDPLNFRQFLVQKLQAMHQGLEFAPGPHLISPDGRTLLIVATPSELARKRASVPMVLKGIERLRSAHPQLNIGLTGGYAVAAQEETLVRGDIVSCLIGSIFGIALLFFLVYRSLVVLAFVLLPLGVGLQLALGVMALAFHRVHLLALAFSAVVLGLGIDFAIHVYDRYALERGAGKTVAQAVERCVFRTGPAVLVGGGTTLVAFLVLTLTDSPLLSQIGWVVPLGLFFCMVTILWALPAWLVWVERRPWGRIKGTMGRLGMAHLGRWVTGHPVMALLVTGFFLAAALPGIGWIRFEQNPMALKPKGLEALDVQQVLVKAFGGGREYVLVAWSASSGETLWRGSHKVDAALAGLKQTGQVHSWTSLSRLCSYQPVHLEGMDGAGISKLFRRYGLRFEDFVHAHGFVKSLLSDPQSNEGSTAVQGRICRRLEQLPQMYGRFFICRKDGLDGIAWAQVSKKGDVDLLRATLSARLPGVIVVNPRLAVRQFLAEVGKELWTTIGLASGLVLGILFLFFRRVSSVLLVLLPMTLGLLTTAGIMGWAGVHINLFNFIVLPILIGIGLDDGIHIFRRYSEMKDIPYTLASTGRSVLVTTLTTACGFGSLLLADYHVLETMGLMTMVGVFACLFFSVMLLPAVLRLLDGPKTGS